MEMVRTTKIQIDLPLGLARQMIEKFTAGCNIASAVAFNLKGASRALALQSKCYQTIRQQTGLSAQVTTSVARVVSAKYTTIRKLKRVPTKPVVFRGEPVQLQGGPRGRDFRFFPADSVVAVSTPEGRLRVTYYTAPRFAEFLSSWNLGGALLTVQKGKVYLLVSFTKEAPVTVNPNNAVVGVDSGIRFNAVATDGSKALFCRGSHARTVRQQYLNTRSSLQSRRAQKDTRSLRRVQKRLRGKERRFLADLNHVVSKEVVEFAASAGCPTIAMEDLTGIRQRGKRVRKDTRRERNGWPFRQLAAFIAYKAEERGFDVVLVDPRYTSQGCSKCGHTEKANRNGLRFRCRACGYQLHSDLQAARNIRLRGICARQVPGPDGLSSISPKHAPLTPALNPDEGTGKPPASAGGS